MLLWQLWSDAFHKHFNHLKTEQIHFKKAMSKVARNYLKISNKLVQKMNSFVQYSN